MLKLEALNLLSEVHRTPTSKPRQLSDFAKAPYLGLCARCCSCCCNGLTTLECVCQFAVGPDLRLFVCTRSCFFPEIAGQQREATRNNTKPQPDACKRGSRARKSIRSGLFCLLHSKAPQSPCLHKKAINLMMFGSIALHTDVLSALIRRSQRELRCCSTGAYAGLSTCGRAQSHVGSRQQKAAEDFLDLASSSRSTGLTPMKQDVCLCLCPR